MEFENYNKLIEYTQKMNTFKEGEVVKVLDENKQYLYHKNEWVERTPKTISMSLYELNKQIIRQLPIQKKEEIEKSKRIIDEYYDNNRYGYFMLLGREIGYFTVFEACELDDNKPLSEEIFECLKSVGKIISIERKEDEGVEFWIKTKEDVTCLYLFPYDNAIVRFRG